METLIGAALSRLWRQPTYILDFSVYHPQEELRVIEEEVAEHGQHWELYSPEVEKFVRKVFDKSGINRKGTYLPAAVNPVHTYDGDISLDAAHREAEQVMIGSVTDLLLKTGIKTADVDILVTCCSIYAPTPSHASTIVNHFKMRPDIQSYSLGGMGCGTGVLGINLIQDLLAAHPNSIALFVPSEITTFCFYPGKELNRLVSNIIFRMGGAAILLTNKPSLAGRSKYVLKHSERLLTARDDGAYRCMAWGPDAEGINGVYLGRDVVHHAGNALEACLRLVAPKIMTPRQYLEVGQLLTRRLVQEGLRYVGLNGASQTGKGNVPSKSGHGEAALVASAAAANGVAGARTPNGTDAKPPAVGADATGAKGAGATADGAAAPNGHAHQLTNGSVNQNGSVPAAKASAVAAAAQAPAGGAAAPSAAAAAAKVEGAGAQSAEEPALKPAAQRHAQQPLLQQLLGSYKPDFTQCAEHFAIHAGGYAVLKGVQQGMGLPNQAMLPSFAALRDYGNTSCSTTWYVLAYLETVGGIKAGDRVLQIGMGGGMKVGVNMWRALPAAAASPPHAAWLHLKGKPLTENDLPRGINAILPVKPPEKVPDWAVRRTISVQPAAGQQQPAAPAAQGQQQAALGQGVVQQGEQAQTLLRQPPGALQQQAQEGAAMDDPHGANVEEPPEPEAI